MRRSKSREIFRHNSSDTQIGDLSSPNVGLSSSKKKEELCLHSKYVFIPKRKFEIAFIINEKGNLYFSILNLCPHKQMSGG